MMFETMVVALDLTEDGDRALPVVAALVAEAAVRVDLVTVSDPGMPTAADAFELERRARRHGWDCDAWTIVHDADPATGLVAHARGQPAPLLVMATSAKRPLSSVLLGSVTRDVLSRTPLPVLLVGPGASIGSGRRGPLIVGVGRTPIDPLAVPTIVSWQATFGGPPPLLVDVVGDPDDERTALARLDAVRVELAARHVDATARVVVADDPAVALEEVAAECSAPVIVASSVRSTDGRPHLHSTTQRLAADATCPVLVVPARTPVARTTAPPADATADDRRSFHDRTTPAAPPDSPSGPVRVR
jgi:nucleotide-binding universal stress UspA family protein